MRKRRKWSAVGAVLALVLLIPGCEIRESKKDYLARVGDSYLTREEIGMGEDTAAAFSDAQIRDHVAVWVNNEILYQEARRQGMENSEAVQQQLAEARKQLSIEALLQKEIYRDTIYTVEDSIKAYFDNHPTEFILREDAVKLNMVVFPSREQANAFRTKLFGGMRWKTAVQTFSTDPSTRGSVLVSIEDRYYTQRTFFPPELWRVAGILAPQEISFPVRTHGGYVVIQTLAVLRQAKRANLDMVRDEIRQRMIIDQRRQRYADLLARLRSRYEVEVTVP